MSKDLLQENTKQLAELTEVLKLIHEDLKVIGAHMGDQISMGLFKPVTQTPSNVLARKVIMNLRGF